MSSTFLFWVFFQFHLEPMDVYMFFEGRYALTAWDLTPESTQTVRASFVPLPTLPQSAGQNLTPCGLTNCF